MTTVQGTARRWLRIEGLLVFLTGVALYSWLDHSWLLFVLLFLTPDLSFLAYLSGPRAGATVYNAVHNYAVPLALGLVGVTSSSSTVVALSLIWVAHIGIDRALGFGLKYPSGFRDTHLGHLGRMAPAGKP
jgi:hypothetical protein